MDYLLQLSEAFLQVLYPLIEQMLVQNRITPCRTVVKSRIKVSVCQKHRNSPWILISRRNVYVRFIVTLIPGIEKHHYMVTLFIAPSKKRRYSRIHIQGETVSYYLSFIIPYHHYNLSTPHPSLHLKPRLKHHHK